MSQQFDLIILGGGPGGYAAALYGAEAGLSIALVEENKLGGTCLQVGCIPAKELLETAHVVRTVKESATFGVNVGEHTIDLAKTQDRKNTIINNLTMGLEGLMKKNKVTVFNQRGAVQSSTDKTVVCDDGSVIQATRALILATGSTPRALGGLDFDGEKILSSDHVLSLDKVPNNVVILGGGAIGCEFASYFSDVGSKVTVIEALPQILTGVDKDAAKVVAQSFKKRGIDIYEGATLSGIDSVGTHLRVDVNTKDGKEVKIDTDIFVVSIGRAPRTFGVNYEENNIRLDERGFVDVDEYYQTSVPGVYAVGDIIPKAQLAHAAFIEAINTVKHILGEDVTPVDYDKLPWGIYTHPEVAFCGLTEEKAKEAGYKVSVSKHKFSGNGRAMIIGDTDGIMKVIAEKKQDGTAGKLLGVHIAGPWATELIGQGYLSVNWEAEVSDLAELIQPHPTLSEMFGETVLSLTGRSLHG